MTNTVRIRGTFDDKITPALGKVDNRFTGLSKSKGFQAVAQGVGLGAGVSAFNLLGNAIGGAVSQGEAAIEAASNLNEQVNKTGAIFRGSADEVLKFGDTTAKAFGISKREALEAAGNFGNMFHTIGLGADVSAQMSTKLVGLAADLASFNNIGTDEALEKIRSGLAGEAEPLRTVGVLLNETAVAAEATNLGFKKVNGQFTEGQKVQARYSLILKQTTAAQGDFSRTSGGMANQQRILAAETEDLQASIGEKLLPSVIEAQRGLIGIFDDIKEGHGPVIAITSAFSDMGKQLDFLVGATEEQSKQSDILGDKTTFLGRALHDIFDSGWQTRMDDGSKALNSTGALLDTTTTKADKFAGGAKRAADSVAKSFDQMVNDMKDDIGRLISDVYDPIEERDRLRANREEAADLQRIISSKKSTDAEIRDAKRKLRALEADNVDYLAKLVESGDATSGEYRRLMTILERKSKTSTGKAKDDVDALIAKLKELHRVEMANLANFRIRIEDTRRANPKDPRRAKGGPVLPGESYTVGEEGPETLVMGDQSGYVIPNGGGSGSGTLTLVNQLVVDGKVLAEAVRKEEWSRLKRSPSAA